MRRPLSAAVISGSCFVLAHQLLPGGLSMDYIPIAFVKVVDNLFDVFSN